MSPLIDVPTTCFVINLDQRPDKLKHFRHEFLKTGLKEYIRVAGVDGDCPDIVQKYDLQLDRSVLNSGEIGCLSSHVAIFDHMDQHNIPYALIFEDDVKFADDFFTQWERAWKQIEQDVDTCYPDIMYLGGRTEPDSLIKGYMESQITNPSPYYDHPAYRMLPPHLISCNELVFMGAFSYCLSLESARMMLKIVRNKSIPVVKPFDLLLTISHHHLKKTIYYCDPLLCYASDVFDSNIANNGNRY